MVDLKASKPRKMAKEYCKCKYENLSCLVEKLVDFESLRVNSADGIKEAFEKQELLYYFDILNGPVYPELVKDFWMKAIVITRKVYDEFVQKMVVEDPSLENKTPKKMGIRPFLGTEI
jgi:hypothetical protein